MGKSLYIKRLADNLRKNLQQSAVIVQVTIPLHGPIVTSDTVMELLKDHIRNPTCCIYHIDIAPNVSLQGVLSSFENDVSYFRCYGKLTQFCSACSSCVGLLIARGGCGVATLTSYTQLKCPSQTESILQNVIRNLFQRAKPCP